MRAHRYATAAVVIVLLAAFAAYADEPVKRTPGQYLDDKVITAKVKAAIVEDPGVKALQIKVESYEGVVQLSGFVDSPEQISRAGEIAKGVEGVKSVKNDLIVRPQKSQ